MAEILCKEECYKIMGACFEVYKDKGCGFLEAVYQECLEIELGLQGVPFQPQAKLTLAYKGRTLNMYYVLDFICYDKVIVELKSVDHLDGVFRAQLHNYLKATGHRLGLLVNFGHHPQVEWERIIR